MTHHIPAHIRMLAAALALCLSPSDAYAQASKEEGLEQTYARLCSNGQQNETCTALRAALMAKLSGQSQSAPTQGVTAAVTLGTPVTPAPVPADELGPTVAGVWEFYSRLAGQRWLVEFNGSRTEEKVEWVDAGRVLCRSQRFIYTNLMFSTRVEHDPAGGRLLILLKSGLGNCQRDRFDQPDVHKIEPSGSMSRSMPHGVERAEVVDNANLRRHYVPVPDATGKINGWTFLESFTRLTPANEHLLAATAEEQRLTADFQRGVAQEVARQAADSAAAANAKKRGGGGLLRAAIGAGLGVAAANASGMDATQTLGAAAKGVALMNPESQAAQVIGASGDAVLQSSGLGTAATGTGASGGSGATYPKRPNVLNNQAACAMMNENTYRQVGVSGGNDVQLKTMCAQAWEYYKMYERARLQGYSEADANRTYAAHQQAAQNAISFYANNRAQ